MTKYLALILLFLTLSNSTAVQEISEDYLAEVKSSGKIWLVYGTTDLSNDNSQILHDVSEVLAGFFKIGILPNDENKLRLYGDDGNVVEFDGKFTVDSIVDFVLKNTNAIIESRSKVANDAKANKEFAEKEKVRANKEWADEQELRKKSDTIVLEAKNWEAFFVKERQPVFINFYEANCTACIELNKEWEAISTALKGKAKVAKINMTEAESLESQIQLSAYPIIRFYGMGNKKLDSFTEFSGIKKKFSILEWANSLLSTKESNVDVAELNKQNYKTLCKDSKSTCIITFVNDPSTVSQQIGELAAKYLKKPISFLISKKGSQAAFEKQLGVDSAPETVMIYCKQSKMLKMGGMDFKLIEEVIGEITNGNRNNFSKFKFEEQLV